MVNITGKRSDPVRKIINIALKCASTVIRKLCKVTQKCHIQVPCLKNHVKIKLEVYNLAQRLEVSQIDSKKSFKFKDHREVGFLDPLFQDRLP